MKSPKFSTLRRIKNKLEETFSLNGVIAIVIIVVSIVFYAIRANVPNFDIWSVLDGAIVNVACSAAIFLMFDIRDAKRSQHLTKIINTKMRKCVQSWDAVVHIMDCDTDKRLIEINKLDMSKFQHGSMAYANNGTIEYPSYHKVLRMETGKLVARMKEFQDFYFDFLNPEVIMLIDEMQKQWKSIEILFNTTTDENDVITRSDGNGAKYQEKTIVFGVRQVTENVKKINAILEDGAEKLS